MPRRPRKHSSTGYYHITNRGVGKARVFNEGCDHAFFLECLRLAQQICSFKVLAYCVMTTHFHIVIKCNGPIPPSLFQSVGARFSAYYHKRHKCAGQIFQGRFRSEAIETEAHLLSAIRYVWRNPVKARLCVRLTDYPWSSYNYLGKSDDLVDNELLCSFMSADEWRDFAQQEASVRHLEPFPRRLSDDAARKIIRRRCDYLTGASAAMLKVQKCPFALAACLDAGMTIAQLARILRIASTTMHRAFKKWGAQPPPLCTVEAATSP